jgi:hypothetical protein
MRRDFRWLIVAVTGSVLLFFVDQANHLLTEAPQALGWVPRVYLYAAGLPIAFAGLRLTLRQAILAVIALGLAADAGSPVPYGSSLLLYLGALAAIFAFRSRLPPDEIGPATLVAVLTTAALFIGLTAISAAGQPNSFIYFGRAVVDLLASLALVTIAGPWFFSLQVAALELFDIRLDEEIRQAR